MGWFAPGRRPLVGVDIGTSAIKLVALGRGDGRCRVECAALEPLPPQVAAEGRLLDPEAAGAAIRRALARSGCRLRDAAAAVAGSAAILRRAELPAGLSGTELESQVQVEARQHIPYPPHEVSFDFVELEPAPQRPGACQVLLAAARSEQVERCAAALELGGLRARAIDVAPLALERACVLLDAAAAGPWALADLGGGAVTLLVLDGHRAVYLQEQPFPGRQLTDDLAVRHGLDAAAAARGLRRGTLPGACEDELVAPFREAAVRQLERLLQFFHASQGHPRPARLWLAGGCAGIAGLAALAQRRLGLPCAVARPFADAAWPTVALAEAAPALMVAAGLALRGPA